MLQTFLECWLYALWKLKYPGIWTSHFTLFPIVSWIFSLNSNNFEEISQLWAIITLLETTPKIYKCGETRSYANNLSRKLLPICFKRISRWFVFPHSILQISFLQPKDVIFVLRQRRWRQYAHSPPLHRCVVDWTETYRCRSVWGICGISSLLGYRCCVTIGLLRRSVSLRGPTSGCTVRRTSNSGRWASHCRTWGLKRGRSWTCSWILCRSSASLEETERNIWFSTYNQNHWSIGEHCLRKMYGHTLVISI